MSSYFPNRWPLGYLNLTKKIVDHTEQYSRRNSLRISGLKENTDVIVTIGCDLHLDEIDKTHRVGKPDPARTRHREILVKFVLYRARHKLYKMRKNLKDNGYDGVFLNEDLTKTRSNVI